MQPIHWFPGHMAKARRQMAEALRLVDAVLELVDARLPIASANPMLRELVGNKPRTIVLTRTDMADERQTQRFMEYFRSLGYGVVGVDARTGAGVKQVLPALETAAQAKRERDAKRGIRPRPLRTMVVGIPNVGKSSLINRMSGRAATKTGDRPGITKTQQWIRLGTVELLDTPGVLWPKLEDEDAAYKLAISGAIKSEILDIQSICAYFLVWVSTHYPDLVEQRYKVALPVMEWTDVSSAWEATEPILSEIALRRGIVRSGGAPDLERVCELVIREVQTGSLGRMTFEEVPEVKEDSAPPVM
jgi:ribosome biogenesis GTPase A